VTAYSLAGALASATVGGALSAAGAKVLPQDGWWLFVPLAVLAAVAVAWDLGWIRWRLLQPRRQTRDVWAAAYGPVVAATLWGFDLGLVVTTRFTFAGVWVLVAAAFLGRDVLLGSTLLLAFWLGRTASVWIGPLLLDDPSRTPQLLDEVNSRYRSFRSLDLLGVGLLVAFVLLHRGWLGT
jgi:hypothetical protein